MTGDISTKSGFAVAFDTPESDAAFNAIFDLELALRDVDDDELFNEVMINFDGSDVSWRC